MHPLQLMNYFLCMSVQYSVSVCLLLSTISVSTTLTPVIFSLCDNVHDYPALI